MIEKIVSTLRLSVPVPPDPLVISETVQFMNLNPQCGSFPLQGIHFHYDPQANFAAFSATLTPSFIDAQIRPRGRPHFSLLHVALLDDAIASVGFTTVHEQPYGATHRYLELGAAVCFHHEAFIAGTLTAIPRGAVEVEGFRTRWQCLPRRQPISIIHRGILQVSILGIRDQEEIQVASVECQYFLGRGVVRGA